MAIKKLKINYKAQK